MNRKNYVSEQRNVKSVIQIDLRNEFSDDSSSDNWTHNEQRYIRATNRFPENNGRRKHIGTRTDERLPPTPPPPVISSQSDGLRVKNHSPRVERGRENTSRPHKQTYLMDCHPPPPIISYAPESYADKTRTRTALNADPFGHDNFVYSNQPSPEEGNFGNFKSSRKAENMLSSPLATKLTREPKKFTLTIVDEGPNQNNLSSMNWRLVESALCTVFLDIMRENPGPPPVCGDARSFLGCAKIIECADERSLKLYSLAISRLGAVWPGAKLAIVDPSHISIGGFRIRATALVPAEPSTNQAILEYIQSSNPDLSTNDWIVLNVGAPSRLSKERHITISFDFGSLAAIEKRRGVINYGLETIILKINRRDLERMQRNKYFERSRFPSLPKASRKRKWLDVAAGEDDDANSESDSEDDEGYDKFWAAKRNSYGVK